jgi:transcriptional regulator with XRE-family HTH domain
MKAKHLTVSDFEKEIGSKSYVSMILNGSRGLTRTHAEKLSARFRVPVDAFFDRRLANLAVGRRARVPHVNLLDPDVEPSSAQMDALLYDVALTASHKARKARQTLMDEVRAAVRSATS